MWTALSGTSAAARLTRQCLEDARCMMSPNLVSWRGQGSIPADTLRVRHDLARSQLAEAEAAHETALSNLRYTSIRSPVDGVVIMLQ